jgi:hypothetical protein
VRGRWTRDECNQEIHPRCAFDRRGFGCVHLVGGEAVKKYIAALIVDVLIFIGNIWICFYVNSLAVESREWMRGANVLTGWTVAILCFIAGILIVCELAAIEEKQPREDAR